MWNVILLATYCLAEAKKQQSVSCGGHRARSCADCGRQEGACNGDCRWFSGICLTKQEAAQKKKATDYYGVLGIPRKSDADTIKAAYKKKVTSASNNEDAHIYIYIYIYIHIVFYGLLFMSC